MALLKYYHPELNVGRFSNAWRDFFEWDNDELQERNLFKPQVDIVETDKAFNINLVVAGINKEDVKIELEDDKLTISGERKTLESDVSLKYHKKQSYYGKFSQSFFLPENVDKENITAKQENGILNIVIQKKEKEESKSIIEVK